MGKQGLGYEAASSGLKGWSEMVINGGDPSRAKAAILLRGGYKNGAGKVIYYGGKRHVWWLRRYIRSIVFTLMLLGFFLALDSFMFSYFDPTFLKNSPAPTHEDAQKETNGAEEETPVMYPRLMNMASASLAERDLQQRASKFWKETSPEASAWKPCADNNTKRAGIAKNTTGFVLVSANGGLNQQRVAVCNAVAVASLLNATLVIPRFLYSNVWKDPR